MVRRGTMMLALVVLGAACSGGGVAESDLATIVIQQSEAPEGTVFVEDQSGPVDLDQLTTNTAQSTDLANDGFISGYDSVFASPGLAGVEGDISRSNSRLIDSSVFLFETTEGAESSFGRLRVQAEATFEEFGTLSNLATDGLGIDAYGIRVEFSNPSAGPDVGIVHSWRIDNVILQVVMWGEMIEVDDVRPLVDLVNTRAKG